MKKSKPNPIVRIPEANVMLTVSSGDIDKEDADRLWGVGKYRQPDECVVFVQPRACGNNAVIVFVDSEVSVHVDGGIASRFGPEFIQLYEHCAGSDIGYLMIDNAATGIRDHNCDGW